MAIYWEYLKDLRVFKTLLAFLIGFGGGVARELGSASLKDVWSTVIKPLLLLSAPRGIATLGGAIRTLVSFLLTNVVSFFLSTVAFAVGVLVGALLASFFWALMDDSPCPKDCKPNESG